MIFTFTVAMFTILTVLLELSFALPIFLQGELHSNKKIIN